MSPLYTQVEAVRFEKSNCMRPPHHRRGYASGHTPSRPVFWNPEINSLLPRYPRSGRLELCLRIFLSYHILAISGYHHLSTKALKTTNGLSNQESAKKLCEGSLIPQPEGQGIHDPPGSRCNKNYVRGYNFIPCDSPAPGLQSLCLWNRCGIQAFHCGA